MIIIGAIGKILHMIITAYIWIIIIATILSWVRPDPYNPIVQVFYRLSFPVLDFLRRKIPLSFNGIDFSPLLLIIALELLDMTLIQMMMRLY
ncbi:YggT family protein [Helicobacter fennelliae]|uniref:Integral membrane protein YggT n=2 Tax=Helicobacter fennelliae TaxID=215 RepID=T1DVF2_9HELI|nr:YggT family protein [Helicobacter fennelliae]GAD18487.1 integral membrane protein YggT [Helicobacter fennelliae MRY12-0050]SQB98803.1 integral membrane protein [Helicobacter fennelliae]STP08146.1 integral membrane protein [Helicobacter fennelliae]STQ83946.1 integral membrane protein [Helicobacter fennelliae]